MSKKTRQQGSKHDLAVTTEAVEMVAVMIDTILSSVYEDNKKEIAEIRQGMHSGTLKIRAALDYSADGIAAIELIAIRADGEQRQILNVDFESLTPVLTVVH